MHMRISLTKLLSLALLCAVPFVSRAAADDPKSAAKSTKAPEEIILDKIDQLQRQLDELRADLIALRTSRTAVPPATAAATPTPVTSAPAVVAAVPVVPAATVPAPTAPAPAVPAVPTQPAVPATTQAAAPAPNLKPDPFAFGDFTWLTGNPRTKDSPLDSKVFTRRSQGRMWNTPTTLNHPADHTHRRIERDFPVQ